MESIKETIERTRLFVIARGVKSEHLIPLADALYEGGVRLLEVTFRSPDDKSTAEDICRLAEHCRGRMQIGAGSVLTVEQVAKTAAAGGRYIVSPNTNPAVIRAAKDAGLVSIPGAMTPSEIEAAHEAGADFVKLFPANVMGLEYIKAVHAPLSRIRLIAVGSLERSDLAAYADAGVYGFGIGQSIVNKARIEAGDFAAVTRLAREQVEELEKIYRGKRSQ